MNALVIRKVIHTEQMTIARLNMQQKPPWPSTAT